MGQKVTIVRSDDGEAEAIYVDGELRSEDDRLTAYQVLRALGVKYEYIECDSEWLTNQMNGFPGALESVKLVGEDEEE